MTYEEIVSRFKHKGAVGAKTTKCNCPAHGDKQASLSITRGDNGGTVLYCHAGCNTYDILAAVGLQMSDLYPDGASKSECRWKSYLANYSRAKLHGELERIDHYHTLDGKYAYTKTRTKIKQADGGTTKEQRYFILRDGNTGDDGYITPTLEGKHVADFGGACYGDIEKAKQAAAAGGTLYYAEGEKCTDCANSHGLTCVTCGGSGDWQEPTGELYRGADAVILADNDAPGLKLAHDVATTVLPIAKSVKIIIPTPELAKGDIYDYYQQGGTTEALQGMIKTAPKVTAADIENWKNEPTPKEDEPQLDIADANPEANKPHETTIEEYEAMSACSRLDAYMMELVATMQMPIIPTGFKKLDKALTGGLYPPCFGILGAPPSVGKTSICVQMCDQLAMSGQDVLYFTLEQGEFELMAKSISRESRNVAIDDPYNNEHLAKSALGVQAGQLWSKYNAAEKAVIKRAMDNYAGYADHIHYKVAPGQMTTDYIKQQVKEHIRLTGNRPVVFLDYLQLVAPPDPKATDKMNTDAIVLSLRQMCRDEQIALIAISSYARGNYKSKGRMDAAKESGIVEYSADLLLSFTLSQIEGSSDEEEMAEKRKTPREMTLTVVKNRVGEAGIEIPMLYYPALNYIEEA